MSAKQNKKPVPKTPTVVEILDYALHGQPFLDSPENKQSMTKYHSGSTTIRTGHKPSRKWK